MHIALVASPVSLALAGLPVMARQRWSDVRNPPARSPPLPAGASEFLGAAGGVRDGMARRRRGLTLGGVPSSGGRTPPPGAAPCGYGVVATLRRPRPCPLGTTGTTRMASMPVRGGRGPGRVDAWGPGLSRGLPCPGRPGRTRPAHSRQRIKARRRRRASFTHCQARMVDVVEEEWPGRGNRGPPPRTRGREPPQ